MYAIRSYYDGDLYITGALSDWQLNDRNKMEYDEASRSYQLTMLLKQGFYNYQYHYLENGTQKAEVSEYDRITSYNVCYTKLLRSALLHK